ncbi:MAG: tryptophan synthase subunit alpha [Solirubrobacterales bacterium]
MAEAANGIGRIAAAFDAARDEGRAALMPYMMGGFPDLETSAALIDAYADTGADLIELGVPYSDPLADGPVIHAAATEALAAGTRFGDVMTLCERVSARVPVLPMVYVNVVLDARSRPLRGDARARRHQGQASPTCRRARTTRSPRH